MQPALWRTVFLGCCCLAVRGYAQADRRSKDYVHPPPHTVSGISAGGDMVMTHLFVESKSVQGAACIAGAPFGCNIVIESEPYACATPLHPRDWQKRFLPETDAYARHRAEAGLIDPVENLVGKRVFLFSGTKDWVVWQTVMRQVDRQLRNFSANTYTAFDVAIGHDWAVDNWTCDAGGPNCGSTGVTNIGYDLVGDFMPFITGRKLRRAHTNHTEHLYWVPQARWVPQPLNASVLGLDPTAFIYLPPQCESDPSKCHIHVQYHGCIGGQWFFGNEQAASYGFSEWAFLNDIIVLYPQLLPWKKDTWGCWDWSGETGVDFDTYRGGQIGTVVNMLRNINEVAAERTNVPATYAPPPQP
eukprot:Hpha_TRINITY_DN31251_c0_g1::TRINITY_DN31251_c0_g1_i1::g.2392::m.2392